MGLVVENGLHSIVTGCLRLHQKKILRRFIARSKRTTGAIIHAWGVYKTWLDTENEKKTRDEIIANILIMIINNQIVIKKHLGLVSDNNYLATIIHGRI